MIKIDFNKRQKNKNERDRLFTKEETQMGPNDMKLFLASPVIRECNLKKQQSVTLLHHQIGNK